ncbi:MAG: septal ring lytic transglycosylase RlpA family protein [Candidatus Kapaibacteriota bacterium]
MNFIREKIVFWSMLILTFVVAGLGFFILVKNLAFAESNQGAKISNSKKLNISDFDISEFFYYKQEGKSSWYGPGFHKKKTASGELFDKTKLTAAHRHLPFGTIVRIRNLVNNKIALVRITDRGPFIYSRIIDLSYYSAKVLDAFGNPNVEIEALLPQEDFVLDLPGNFYFGYSFEFPLVCLPENKIVFLQKFDTFDEAVEFYQITQQEYPELFVYLFVPANQTYENISYSDGEKYFVGYFDSSDKTIRNNFAVKINPQ